MKKILNAIKKGVKWYFDRASKSYYLTPTGCISIWE